MVVFNKENVIGIKRLSNADLGWNEGSRQTHIGLSELVLKFLPLTPVVCGGVIIFNNRCYYAECYFSKITESRSTKIDSGKESQRMSLTRQVRSFAQNRDVSWCLAWFATQNETPVFWLFNDQSDEYRELENAGVNISGTKTLSSRDPEFHSVRQIISKLDVLNDFLALNERNFAEGMCIASSKEHRTFVRLCLNYFESLKSLDRMLPYFSTRDINSPIKVSNNGSFNLQNMFIFSDAKEIERRNSVHGARWYTDFYGLDGKQLYLYRDWYAGVDANGRDNQLMIPHFVNLVRTCYGRLYEYVNNQGVHELWMRHGSSEAKCWIIPANNTKFNIVECFNKRTSVDWKQSCNFSVGDIVYLYCSEKIRKILYKAEVVAIDLSNSDYANDKEFWADPTDYDKHVNDSSIKYARLVLQKALPLDDDRLSLQVLQNLGLKNTIQGPMAVPNQAIQDKLDEVFDGKEIASVEKVPFNVDSAISAIKSSGLIYDDLLIKRFATSLLTKPFVILSGLAGSGKTQLALAFAKALVAEESQMCVVSVGADWTNREPLLGYPNALKDGEYVHPESGVLDLLIEADKPENKDKPYFLILDEMNLSYVERYFADFLSAMESRESIRLWDVDNDNTPKSVSLPKNLFIVGTINVDETTYMFSPKVLDRANVIEFKVSEDEMTSFLDQSPVVDLTKIDKIADQAADFVRIAKTTIAAGNAANDVLKAFFKPLKEVNAEFGYRTAAEIGRFIGLANSMTLDEAIDSAIVQKLLPKLHGSRKKIVPVLKALWTICVPGVELENALVSDADRSKYPLAADKILRMYNSAVENGFTSFAEA